MRFLILATTGLLAAAALPAPAFAAASDWSKGEHAQVRLVSAGETAGESAEHRLGLHFRLKGDWKVYWRAPGDAGFPPSIDWAGSENLASAAMAWPAPERFQVSGLQTIGYKHEVIFPIAAIPASPGQPLRLKAAVEYLACDAICVPGQADLVLDLPAGPATASAEAQDIARFAATVPGDGRAHGLTLLKTEAWGSGDAASLRVIVAAEPPLAEPDLFIEAKPGFEPPQVRLEESGRRAVLSAKVVPGTLTGPLAGQPLTVTVAESGRGLEARIIPAAASGPVEGGLAAMLGMALLGGLILNLMPCVLPVLSLKVFGLIGHAGSERRQIRLGFAASALGIITSFLGLAAVAIALKAAGAAVGWGIQFQQPAFLVAMTVLVVLFAGNLWGLFEIPLPHWLAGVGRGHGVPHSLAGHFATGAFATLLATPCSAPFLGTAVGFALARGPVEIAAVFLMLGLGMALPYLLVAAWPAIGQRLPRPGRWMLSLRRGLAVVLVATAVWLLTITAALLGQGAAALLTGLMVAIVVVLGLRARLAGRFKPLAGALVAGLALLALGVPRQAVSLNASAKPSADGIRWETFDRAALARLVGDGKTVLVDVTADWCITCKVNKTAVIERGAVAEALKAGEVLAMRADWTRPDADITAYLAGFGRYGIPFNAVYGPKARDGIALPELLSSDAVMEAIRRAR